MEKLEPKSNEGKVPFISKFAYGFGDIGCNFSWSFVVSFLMIFYTALIPQHFDLTLFISS